MTLEHAESILRNYITLDPIGLDEMETYLFGPDNPEDYFATIGTKTELIADFELFRRDASNA